ncbi:MAG TPA: hypothetical protein VLH59_00280 [Ignavibacteriaceae bacterium]|nr:hypothetical protein [Ignavibacteriaceae bacterium]
MKTITLDIIIAIGLIIILYTGFNYLTREKLVDVSSMEITTDINSKVIWDSFADIGVIIIGELLYEPVGYGRKK